MEVDAASTNPFIRYRVALDSYAAARKAGLSDADFASLVQDLDQAVAAVDGRGFVVTPTSAMPELSAALVVDAAVWVKDDTGNVSGSHKGRHLFGLMLHLLVAEHAGVPRATAPLAIASCGNAALAAAVVAEAVGRALQVFIPPDADPRVVERLTSLNARIEVCPRRAGETGDPCYLRFREAVGTGAVPFSCQGSDAPHTIDGGRTLVWELAEALRDADGRAAQLDALYVQVGGGALASSCARALDDVVAWGWLSGRPALHLVQTLGAHPLVRAWDRASATVLRGGGDPAPDDELGPDAVMHRAARAIRIAELEPAVVDRALVDVLAAPDRYMWAWEQEPRSIAQGIIDDVTYDWPDAVRGMLVSAGWPTVVDDDQLTEALRLLRAVGLPADATGAAAFAGLAADVSAGMPPATGGRVAVTVTGRRREVVERAVNG